MSQSKLTPSFQFLNKSQALKDLLPMIIVHNSNTDPKKLEKRLDEMMNQGFECVGIYNNNELIGMTGLWTLTRLYSGKYLEPDNVYVKNEYRSKGIGEHLIDWLEALAKKRNCEVIELNCYIANEKGLNFWKKNNFKALGYHFIKEI